ncbi:MAG: ABC transporter ATP-binding protein [Planctomycetes bacterium]|nr:ABC transporter ATP-binding protein [Planctomycetota bacterium]
MIVCEHVSKWYGQVSALVDVSFQIRSGVVGLVGRNGAGKSSLMKILAGLIRPSHGGAAVCGADPTRAGTRRAIGFCPDLDVYFEHLSGVRFLTWMLRLDGRPARLAKALAGTTLEGLGLGDAMHRPIRGYSKGMRQRVKLGLALAHEPTVVLLDEPMTGLDPLARRDTAQRIAELGARGVVVLVSSHVLHELEELVDRVLLLHEGRLVADGGVAELRALLADRPYRIALGSRDVRALAARISGLDVVTGLRIGEREVEVETDGGRDLFETLTALGAEADGLVDEVRPLDAGLEAVFDYLVERRFRRTR